MSEGRYLAGFGNQFESEAVAGALPVGRNSPQRPPLGLYAELLSGSAFTAPVFQCACGRGSWAPVRTLGWRRYIQVRRLSARGAVKALPETCSAYSPKATCCGEFWPCGSAPPTASVACSLPKPAR